jgi:dUTP pyrophosphatase
MDRTSKRQSRRRGIVDPVLQKEQHGSDSCDGSGSVLQAVSDGTAEGFAIRIDCVNTNPETPIPTHKTPGSAGLDLYATEGGIIWPGEQKVVGTGLHLAIPLGIVGLVKSRSGLSIEFGLEHGAGVIGPDYRGEIRLILRHLEIRRGSDKGRPFRWEKGDRLTQILFVPYIPVILNQVSELDKTEKRS